MSWCSSSGGSDDDGRSGASAMLTSPCVGLPIAAASFLGLAFSILISLRIYFRREANKGSSLSAPLILTSSDNTESGVGDAAGMRANGVHGDTENGADGERISAYTIYRFMAIGCSLALAALGAVIFVREILAGTFTIFDAEWAVAAIGWGLAAWALKDEGTKAAGDRRPDQNALRLYQIALYIWAPLQIVSVFLMMLYYENTAHLKHKLSIIMLLLSGIAAFGIYLRNSGLRRSTTGPGAERAAGRFSDLTDDNISIDGDGAEYWFWCWWPSSSRMRRTYSASERIRKSHSRLSYQARPSSLHSAQHLHGSERDSSLLAPYQSVEHAAAVDIENLMHSRHTQVRKSSLGLSPLHEGAEADSFQSSALPPTLERATTAGEPVRMQLKVTDVQIRPGRGTNTIPITTYEIKVPAFTGSNAETVAKFRDSELELLIDQVQKRFGGQVRKLPVYTPDVEGVDKRSHCKDMTKALTRGLLFTPVTSEREEYVLQRLQATASRSSSSDPFSPSMSRSREASVDPTGNVRLSSLGLRDSSRDRWSSLGIRDSMRGTLSAPVREVPSPLLACDVELQLSIREFQEGTCTIEVFASEVKVWVIRKTESQLRVLCRAVARELEKQPVASWELEKQPGASSKQPHLDDIIEHDGLQQFLNDLAQLTNTQSPASSIIMLFFEAGSRAPFNNNEPPPLVDVKIVTGQNGRIHCILQTCGKQEDEERRQKARLLKNAFQAREGAPLNEGPEDAIEWDDPQKLAAEAVEIFIEILRVIRFAAASPSSTQSNDASAVVRAASMGIDDFDMFDEDYAQLFAPENTTERWVDLLRLQNAVAHTTAAHEFRRRVAGLCAPSVLERLERPVEHEYLVSALLNISNAAMAHAVLSGLPFPPPRDHGRANFWYQTGEQINFKSEQIRYNIGGLILSYNEISHYLLRAKSCAVFRRGVMNNELYASAIAKTDKRPVSMGRQVKDQVKDQLKHVKGQLKDATDQMPHKVFRKMKPSRSKSMVMSPKSTIRSSITENFGSAMNMANWGSSKEEELSDRSFNPTLPLLSEYPKIFHDNLNPITVKGMDQVQLDKLTLERPEPLVTFCLFTASRDSPPLRVFYPHSVRVMMHIAADDYLSKHVRIVRPSMPETTKCTVEIPFILHAFAADVRNRSWRSDDSVVSHWRREYALLQRHSSGGDSKEAALGYAHGSSPMKRYSASSETSESFRSGGGFHDRAQDIGDHDFSLLCTELMMGLAVSPSKGGLCLGQDCEDWFENNGFNNKNGFTPHGICEALVRDDYLETVVPVDGITQIHGAEYHPDAKYRFARSSKLLEAGDEQSEDSETFHRYYGFLWGHLLFDQQKRTQLRELADRRLEVSTALGLLFLRPQ